MVGCSVVISPVVDVPSVEVGVSEEGSAMVLTAVGALVGVVMGL